MTDPRGHVYASQIESDLYDDMPVWALRLDKSEFPVIYSTTGQQYPLGAANYIGRDLHDRPALFLMFFTWAAHEQLEVNRSRDAVSAYRRRRPLHRFIFLCNDDRERNAHAAAGLDAILCNANAFSDEDVFKPSGESKQYNAVYNAAIIPWKRHELTRLIESCVHITYRKDELTYQQALDRLNFLKRLAPSHHFANPIINDRIMPIPAQDVATLTERSRCGLCLSAVEGAMLASIEYLLTGVPVVSTASVGGRETFADRAFWRTVSPDADSVAAGVREMIARDIDPQQIREATLTRVKEHRARLRVAVEQATDGAVELPADLGDRCYRFNSNFGYWPRSSNLKVLLNLRSGEPPCS